MKIKAPFQIETEQVRDLLFAHIYELRGASYHCFDTRLILPLQELPNAECHPVRRDTDPGSTVDGLDADFG
jgi:hypothetical protein